MLKFICIFLSCLISMDLFIFKEARGQENETDKSDYYDARRIRYEDYIYNDSIKTVLLHPVGFELSEPIMTLGSLNKLNLSFDDLMGDFQTYRYTYIHCDADWKPSDIRPYEYLEGYYDDLLENYVFSFNTLQPYKHYELEFPTENMQIKKSGNYILLVFPEGSAETPVLTARFYVVSPRIRVAADIRQATKLDDRTSRQEVRFSLFTSGYPIIDPYHKLKVHIKQNGRWDNMITKLSPLIVKGDELNYQHEVGNDFSGGNEFRRFDVKSIKYPSEDVERIEQGDRLYEVFLKKDERRTFKVYVTEDDMDGYCYIKTLDMEDAATEADYVYVNFSLSYSPPLINGNLYVMGAMTQWKFSRAAMMKYNFVTQSYEARLLLKQGYYNYQYVFLENGKTTGDEALIEGQHHETENAYSLFVYYMEPGTIYHQLIAAEMVNSRVRK